MASAAEPTVVHTAKSGRWSQADTWEGGKPPPTGAKVLIRTARAGVYDAHSDQGIRSPHVSGTLSFARDRSTRPDVGPIKIQAGESTVEEGLDREAHVSALDSKVSRSAFEVGTADEPTAHPHTALVRPHHVAGVDAGCAVVSNRRLSVQSRSSGGASSVRFACVAIE